MDILSRVYKERVYGVFGLLLLFCFVLIKGTNYVPSKVWTGQAWGCQTPSGKANESTEGWGHSLSAEHLPSKWAAICSNPSLQSKKQKTALGRPDSRNTTQRMRQVYQHIR
jgi:hypothetical protein